MENPKAQCVSYLRVSTQKQGITGLGIDAQRASVAEFIHQGRKNLLAEFAEVESGKRKDRPELEKAIALCRKTKATLVIAKLDRLARNVAFILNLKESGVDFVAVDMPQANKLTVTILAAVAEQERDWISERTKAGLAAAKRRGIKLGNPRLDKVRSKAVAANQARARAFAAKFAPVLKRIEKAGVTTQQEIAECLNARGFTSGCQRRYFRGKLAASIFKVKRTPDKITRRTNQNLR